MPGNFGAREKRRKGLFFRLAETAKERLSHSDGAALLMRRPAFCLGCDRFYMARLGRLVILLISLSRKPLSSGGYVRRCRKAAKLGRTVFLLNVVVFSPRPSIIISMKRLQAYQYKLTPNGDPRRFIFNKALAR